MTITTDLDDIQTTYSQIEIARKYYQIFKTVLSRLSVIDAEVDQAIADNYFDAIPTSIKQAMNKIRQEIKTFNATILADVDIQELINWPPAPEPPE